jgi:hypothetical protein
MKVEKGGYLSQPQKEIIAYLKAHGNTVAVGRGFDDAKAQVQKFMRECGY